MSKKNYAARDEDNDVQYGISLREAARMARENGGPIWKQGEGSYEDSGLDPYSEEFDTKADLRKRLGEAMARTASEREHKEKAIKRYEDQQRALVDAGLIPIELLGAFVESYDLEYLDGGGNLWLHPAMIPRERTGRLRIAMRMPGHGTPAHHAITALLNYRPGKTS